MLRLRRFVARVAVRKHPQCYAGDSQDRDQPFDADRADQLNAGRDQHRIGKRGWQGRFRPLSRAGLGAIFKHLVNDGHDHRDDEECERAGEARFDRAVFLAQVNERRGAKKRQRDQQGHHDRRGEICQPQGPAGGFLEIIDHALKHGPPRSKSMLAKRFPRLLKPPFESSKRLHREWCGDRYRRHVRPIRKPRPSARPTVASGRCWTTSSSVSSIEETVSWAAPTTALPRSEISSTAESTLARACL